MYSLPNETSIKCEILENLDKKNRCRTSTKPSSSTPPVLSPYNNRSFPPLPLITEIYNCHSSQTISQASTTPRTKPTDSPARSPPSAKTSIPPQLSLRQNPPRNLMAQGAIKKSNTPVTSRKYVPPHLSQNRLYIRYLHLGPITTFTQTSI